MCACASDGCTDVEYNCAHNGFKVRHLQIGGYRLRYVCPSRQKDGALGLVLAVVQCMCMCLLNSRVHVCPNTCRLFIESETFYV